MNNFPRYHSYKDSGVEWLGKIPEHWEIQRGKWLFVKQDRPVRKEDEIITCFRDGQVTLRANRKTEGFTNALKEHGYQGIRKGDLVIHNMDAFAGAIGVSDSDGKSTPVYSACTPRKQNAVNSYFFAYFLRDLAKSGYIESLAKGIRERSTDFRFNDFGELLLSVPPLSEQTAIVEFLDRKTAQIEQAIAQKERLIELLKERRQILIHKAVTRGLNPHVKLKHSGVDWIGEIPEHWNVSKLSYLTEEIGDGLHGTPEYVDDSEYSFINGNNLVNGEIKITEQTKKVSFKEFLKYQTLLNDKTILLSINGTIGNLAFYKGEKVMLGKSAAYINFVSGINLEFVYYFLGCYASKLYFDKELSGSTINNLSLHSIKKTPILIPSKNEQEIIVSYLKNATNKIEIAISCKQKEIEKLKEYKAVLINSAVTGKIKVCGNSQNAEVRSNYAKSNE